MEIVLAVAYTGGSTIQAVHDAFAAITYQDVLGLPAAVAGVQSEIAALRDQLNGTF